jgi:hypothetical protein
MVTIAFPDRETEERALAFLLGRFSGRVLRSGEHLVPEAALEALADQNIPFTVKGSKKKLEVLNREIAIGLEQANRGEFVEFDFDNLMQEVDDELGYTNAKYGFPKTF